MKMKIRIVAAALAATAPWAQAQEAGVDDLLKDISRRIVAAKRAPTPERAIENCWNSASAVCVSRLTLRAAKMFGARSDWELEIRAGAFAAGAAAQAAQGNAAGARTSFDLAVAAARTVKSGSARVRALRNVASVQAGAGEVDYARATATSILDVPGRVDALIGVASASSKKGDLSAALGSFRLAVSTARSIGDRNLRSLGLNKVVMAQAAVGYTASARATARSIEDVEGRIDALIRVASASVKAGRAGDAPAIFNLAIEAAGSVGDGYRRTLVLGKIAWAQAESGNDGDARMTLDSALEASGRGMDIQTAGAAIAALTDVDPHVFIQVANAQMKMGDPDGARQTLERAFESVRADMSTSQIKWLFNIASARTAAGDADGARQTTDTAAQRLASAADADIIQNLAYHIAPDQLDKLLEIAGSLTFKDTDAKKNLVYHVAMRQAQTGAIERSLHNARRIHRASRRDAVFSEIVTAQAGAEKFTAATATAESINDTNKRIRAFVGIGQAQARAGDVEKARRTVALAAAERARAARGVITAWTLTELAAAQVAAGRDGDARRTVRDALLKLRSASRLARATWLPGILNVVQELK